VFVEDNILTPKMYKYLGDATLSPLDAAIACGVGLDCQPIQSTAELVNDVLRNVAVVDIREDDRVRVVKCTSPTLVTLLLSLALDGGTEESD
jgi:hypothetical protein